MSTVLSNQNNIDSNSPKKEVCVRRRMKNGEIKTYRYNTMSGVEVGEYLRNYHKAHYIPVSHRILKYKKLSKEMKEKILGLHAIGISQAKIVKILKLEDPQTNIGLRTVIHLIHDQE